MRNEEISLAVYDLSRGMASGLSAQFLGPSFAIDAIPHTGVVVYGTEFFFGGGGIQSEDPISFRRSTGLAPMNVLSVGRTSLTRAQFEAWCQQMMENQTYAAHSYDLLTRNCNNFSHDALTQFFGVESSAFPSWILEVPRRFMSSPMGQMVMPMLQNMQLSNVPGAQTMTATSISSSNNRSNISNPWGSASPTNARTASAAANPWVASESGHNSGVPKTSSHSTAGTPILDSLSTPLLSTDTKTVALCVQKLMLSSGKERMAILQATSSVLRSKDQKLPRRMANDICDVLLTTIKDPNSASLLVFALMLLRLVILRSEQEDAFVPCTQWLQNELTAAKKSNTALLSAASQSMGWMCASNAIKSLDPLEAMVEAAVCAMTDNEQSKEVRQAASAFLYNAALALKWNESSNSDELPVVVVSMLCASLEGIEDEIDHTVRLRRLMVIGRLVKMSERAKLLVKDLELVEGLATITSSGTADGKKAAQLARELMSILGSAGMKCLGGSN